MLTVSAIRSIMPLAGKAGDTYAPFLSAACDRFEINTPARLAAFLAQLAEESEQLTRVVECCNYRDPERLYMLFPRDFRDINDAIAAQARGEQAIANRIYANQNGNGAESSGDGWNFRGRGPAQLTGRNNYGAAGNTLGLDLLNHPELLEQPEHGANAAAWFWDVNHLNHYADAGQFQAICGVWNVGDAHAHAGAIIGLTDRTKFYSRGLETFKQ